MTSQEMSGHRLILLHGRTWSRLDFVDSYFFITHHSIFERIEQLFARAQIQNILDRRNVRVGQVPRKV